MAMTRNDFADLMNPEIRKIYFDHLSIPAKEYDKVFTMENSTRRREITSEVYSFGPAPLKGEGEDIQLDTAPQGYDYTFTHSGYGSGFVVTEELIEDDEKGIIRKLPKKLGDAMRETVEVAAANVFNRAFNASYTFGDSAALCVSTHKNEYTLASSESNLLTVAADLSTTSLKAALTQMKKMVGPRGEFIDVKPDILLIPPDLEFDAFQLLNSVKLPGTDINDINSIRGLYKLAPFCMRRLTDADAWFLLGENREQLVFWWRKQPDLKDDLHISSRDVEYNSFMRFSTGAAGWRWLIGTPGTA